MADETNPLYLAGLIVGIKERLDKTDEHLTQQDRQREAMHDQNQTAIETLRQAMDGTATITRENQRWISENGKPLERRVAALEDKHNETTAEARGGWKVWALIGSGVVAFGTFLGWLGLDRLSALLFRLSVSLGGGHG